MPCTKPQSRRQDDVEEAGTVQDDVEEARYRLMLSAWFSLPAILAGRGGADREADKQAQTLEAPA